MKRYHITITHHNQNSPAVWVLHTKGTIQEILTMRQGSILKALSRNDKIKNCSPKTIKSLVALLKSVEETLCEQGKVTVEYEEIK